MIAKCPEKRQKKESSQSDTPRMDSLKVDDQRGSTAKK